MRTHVRRFADEAVRHTVAVFCAVARWVRELWRRLTNEPGYAEALAALVVSAADLFVSGHQVRRLLHESARTFVVVVRSLMGDRGMPDTFWN